MKKIILLAALAALAGCGVAPTAPTQRMAFPEEEYAALEKSGTGQVTGQVFLKTRGGDVKTGAGNEVFLNPVTSYSREWFTLGYNQGLALSEVDARLTRYLIKTTADATGRFALKNVPPGEYYLTSSVTWEAPTGYQAALVRQGGFISKPVSVDDGAVIDVILTR